MLQEIKEKLKNAKEGFMLFIFKVLIIALYFFVSIAPTALMCYGLNLILDFYKLKLILYSWLVILILLGWLIFWFYVFFVNIRKKESIGTIFVLEKPTERTKKSGLYLKFPWIEESIEFSREPHTEEVTFDENDDIYVAGNIPEEKGGNYLVGSVEIVWQVKSPGKYYLYQKLLETKIEREDGKSTTLLSRFVVAAVRLYAVEPFKKSNGEYILDDAGEKKYPNMDYILKNGRTELPDIIIRELIIKKVGDTVIEERETIDDWGIELVTRPRLIDIDPLPGVKEAQKKAAQAVYDKTRDITNAEANFATRELGAKAKEVEGFADAAIEGKKIEKQFSALLEAAGVKKDDKESAMNFILARIGLDAIKSGDKIILGTSGIMDLAKEFAASLKEKK